MSENHRLTRDELSWLLTQEARGAAERLRQGVQILTRPPPPPTERTNRPASERPLMMVDSAGLESSLELLESTMDKLTQIAVPPTAKERKGRVDLAALLWEVSPDAKVQLMPGQGTEVYGDPRDLRRMLHVLLGSPPQGSGSVVELARKGDEVVLSISLGPDVTPLTPPERRWLSQMAVRYGGRYELEGPREVIALPADTQHREVENLRKELQAAKAQGEAYARELASVFDEEPLSVERNTSLNLAGFAHLAHALMDDLRTIFGPLGVARARGAAHADLLEATQLALSRGAALLSMARQMSGIASDSGVVEVDLAHILHNEVVLATPSFSAAGVGVILSPDADGPSSWVIEGLPTALRAMVAELLDRMLRVSLPGDEIRTTVREGRMWMERTPSDSGVRLSLRDGANVACAFVFEIARTHELRLSLEDHSIELAVQD